MNTTGAAFAPLIGYTEASVVGGRQTALIVGLEGEEIYTDHLNRVRV